MAEVSQSIAVILLQWFAKSSKKVGENTKFVVTIKFDLFESTEIGQVLAKPFEETSRSDPGQPLVTTFVAVSNNEGDKEAKGNLPLLDVKQEFLSKVEVKSEIIDLSSDSEGETAKAEQLTNEGNQKTVDEDPLGFGVVLTQKDLSQNYGM